MDNFLKLGVYTNFSYFVLSLKIPEVSLKVPVLKGWKEKGDKKGTIKGKIKLEV